MKIVYQPIIDLSNNETVGYEALSRFPNDKMPDDVFKEAWQNEDGVQLEVEAFETAVRNFPSNINEAYLAINSSAKTIIAMRGRLVEDPGTDVPWPRMVIEISEK